MGSLSNDTVVVPWDYSENCLRALETALQITGDARRVRVLHVAGFPRIGAPEAFYAMISQEEMLPKALRAFREQVPEQKFGCISFDCRFGDAGHEIADFAREVNADLIVIPSHGRRGIPRWLIGSVAERVTRLAPCPVLVMRALAA